MNRFVVQNQFAQHGDSIVLCLERQTHQEDLVELMEVEVDRNLIGDILAWFLEDLLKDHRARL